MKRRLAWILAAVLCAGAWTWTGPGASADVADWEMNEHESARVLHDLSAHTRTGHIGRYVRRNGSYHHFRAVKRGVYAPGHIDVVPHRPALNPGSQRFFVSVKFRWPRGNNDNNLVQKGQGSPTGGLFKMKTSVPSQGQPTGHLKCLFRGSTGDSQVESYSSRRVDNDQWHVVTCGRTASGTVMKIDGTVVDRNGNDPGTIRNDWPVAIGGNSSCDSPDLECNYWRGDIGFVRWGIEHPRE